MALTAATRNAIIPNMNARDRRHIGLATEIARKTQHDSPFHLAAVLAKGKGVISVGVNYTKKTHTQSNTRFRYLHAEVDSIIGVRKEYLKGATLYVSRVGYDYRTEILCSKPCASCQAAIERAGIKEVYFTLSNNSIGHWNVRKNAWSEYPSGITTMRFTIQHDDTSNANGRVYSGI